ncbi:MAG: PQQ-dependent sugar dehydrogenase, partial [Pirellulales bacterium]|nr:PQQ-dependent sugar dehydrogenase [Pirellulales bacterium]
GQRLDLWVALDGATYYGNAAQTEADFSILARASDVVAAIPFTPQQPGYVVEAVAGGFQLPTNIAFVPNPGPNPSDPYFYVTELYGTIRVVSRDFTVSAYATGLLNFNPTGSFPGSGEQGLAGIVVDPATGDLFATRVTATDPAFPNGAHHPQVLRFTSADGGRTASTMSVIKDMPGETMGQSHQISNLTIGPDGLLYVHVGEGFDAARALDLNSYRGKILRMNFDGSAAADNPLYDAGDGVNARDYIFAYGFRNPFGGAWRAADGQHYEVENGPGSNDRLARVDRGASYGWNGSDGSMRVRALYNWGVPHAPVNITFVQPATFAGSQFPPGKQDHAFVSESGPTYGLGPQALGKRIVEFAFSASGGVQGGPTTLVEYTGTGRGTVVGLTAGPDGLYFTELYKDFDAATPIDAGARVFRVRYIGQTRGDYNWDGASDGADFLKWQQTLGSTSDLSADGNRDRIVGAGDLASWQNAFGGAGGSFETAALGAADSLAPPDAPAPAAIQDAALAALATAGASRDAYRPPLDLTVPRTLPRPPVATATVRATAFRERQSAVAGAVAPNAEIVSSTTAPSSPAQPAPEDDGSLPPALKRSTRAAYRPS